MSEKVSLLQGLVESDFNIVYNELYSFKDSSFHYALDFHDIKSYCFPFGIGIEKKEDAARIKEKTIDYITDEQYTFYNILYNSTGINFILDEYIPEISGLTSQVHKAIHEGFYHINTLEKYEEEFHRVGTISKKKDDKILEIIETKLSLILAISNEHLNSGIDKFLSLVRDHKLIIDIDAVPDTLEGNYLKEAFIQNHGSALTKALLPEILGEISTSINNASQLPDAVVRGNLELAKERDAKVIDRVITVNKFLEDLFLKGELKKRHIVLYVSTTSTANKLANNQVYLDNIPIINDQKFNPIRNLSQIFLKSLCVTQKFGSLNSKENFNHLGKRIMEINRFQDKIPAIYLKAELESLLKIKFNYYRENFESQAILNRFENIELLVENSLKKFKEEEGTINIASEIIPILSRIIDVGKKNADKSIQSYISLENWRNHLLFSYYLRTAIEQSDNLYISALANDDDIIKGINHIIPLIFNFKDQSCKQIIDKIGNYIIDKNSSFSWEKLKIFFSESYEELIKIPPSMEERLVKAIVFTLIPPINNSNPSKLAYSWAKEILNKELSLTVTNENEEVLKNYVYFVGCAARRNGFFTESVKLFSDWIKKFPYEPRFYHGLFLSKYCLYEKSKIGNEKDDKIEALKELISVSSKAQSLYKIDNDRPIIKKQMNSVINSIVYFECELFELTWTNSILHEARIALDSLKANDDSYSFYPEYLHTEAYLELCEFYVLRESFVQSQEKEIIEFQVWDKINNALLAVRKAIRCSITRNLDYNLVSFSDLHKRIYEARADFIKEFKN